MSPHPPKTCKPIEVGIFDDGFDENPDVAYSETVMRTFDPACTQNCPTIRTLPGSDDIDGMRDSDYYGHDHE